MTAASVLDWAPSRDELTALAQRHREAFESAQPFQHVVIDDFLPRPVLDGLIESFPGPDDTTWGSFDNRREIKLALNDESLMPRPIRHVIQQLNAQVAIEFFEALTGIDGLVADPHLYGGGLHQIRPGGLLKVHADFDMHKKLQLHRRLNAILYLNEDWDESYGGALELWNLDMTHAVEKVYPLANRLVVFATTDTSWHGHPDALACPPDRTRRSMAWYYYTAPEPGRTGHSTIFQPRPDETIQTQEETAAQRRAARVAAVKNTLRPLRNRLPGR